MAKSKPKLVLTIILIIVLALFLLYGLFGLTFALEAGRGGPASRPGELSFVLTIIILAIAGIVIGIIKAQKFI